jgi:hypothetical protein
MEDVHQVYCSVFLIKITIFNTKTLKTPALVTRALGGEANLTPLLSPYMAWALHNSRAFLYSTLGYRDFDLFGGNLIRFR